MIFQHTWHQILEGKKVQTRRLVKPTHRGSADGWSPTDRELYYAIWQMNKRRGKDGSHSYVYQAGHIYAVQPGRGKAAIWWKPDTGHVIDNPVFRIGSTTSEIVEPEDYLRVDLRDGLKDNGYVPLQICITKIRREDVREISHDDARAEGFESKWQFLSLWAQINDKTLWQRPYYSDESFRERQRARPLKFYDAWCLDFEVVR